MRYSRSENGSGSFTYWLRTGRWPPASKNGLEFKFNPYHDPRNGRFTFAPGGRAGSLDPVASARNGRSSTRPDEDSSIAPAHGHAASALNSSTGTVPIFDGPQGRGGNARAFFDPMTLEQAFPGLANTPAERILATADFFFDARGPARAMTAEMTARWTKTLIAQIRELDPNYHFQSVNVPQSFEGQMSQLDGLRFERAATYFRVKNDPQPLQVETLRFVQRQTDQAYDRGLKLLRNGKLPVRLSPQEALGNYVDREVRTSLRRQYNIFRIASSGSGPVRVNRREYDNSGSEAIYRQPDSRVADLAIDVTLARKGPRTPQVRGFFSADFRPNFVVIVRPSQLGPGHTYMIRRGGRN